MSLTKEQLLTIRTLTGIGFQEIRKAIKAIEVYNEVPTQEDVIEYLKLTGQPLNRKNWTAQDYVRVATRYQPRKLYISDTHFGHANIIRYENRPYNSVEEMDSCMIHTWNEYVNPRDEVYILGDFSFYKDPEKNNAILESLNGHKFLIEGNHDHGYLNKEGFHKYEFQEISSYKSIKDNNQYVVLFHYPIQTWDRQHYGAIHLYGHVHSNNGTPPPMRYRIPNSYNVCWDMIGHPMTLAEILTFYNT